MNEHEDMGVMVPRFRSAMLAKAAGLFGWFGRRYFDHIRLASETESRLREVAEEGGRDECLLARHVAMQLFKAQALPQPGRLGLVGRQELDLRKRRQF